GSAWRSTSATTRSTRRKRTRSRGCSSACSGTRWTPGTRRPRRGPKPRERSSPTEPAAPPRSQRASGRRGAGAPPPGARHPSWRWPGWRHVGEAAWLEAVVGAWLCLLFYGTDALAGWRRFRVPVHLPFERDLPLVPGLIVAYLSIHVVFALAPFALPTRRELRALMETLAVVIGVAAVGFLLLPADLAFPPATGLGIWERPFRLADRLNGDHNLVPSLHVALSVTCLAAYARNASRVGA